MPVLAVTLSGKAVRIGVTAVLTIAALLGLGALGAQLGGAPRGRAAIRVVTLSTVSMPPLSSRHCFSPVEMIATPARSRARLTKWVLSRSMVWASAKF